MRNLIIREYTAVDKESLLGIYKLNTPQYFSADEEKDLLYYLENEIEYYFVLELNQQVVGGGGFNFSGDKTIGKISWDLIHPDIQGKSLGSILLKHRIEKLKIFPTVEQITVRTSQFVYQFYEKSGFQLIEVVEDYWAKGYHLYKMQYVN